MFLTHFFFLFSGNRCRCILLEPLGEVFFFKERKDAISPFPLQRQSALTRKIRGRRRGKKGIYGKMEEEEEILPFIPSSSPEVFPRDICLHSEKKVFTKVASFYTFLWERRSIMTRIVRKKPGAISSLDNASPLPFFPFYAHRFFSKNSFFFNGLAGLCFVAK